MAANVSTGRVRTVRYNGRDYTVRPSGHPDAVTGKKQVWEVECDGVVIRPWVHSLSKAAYHIHEHAAECGLTNLDDGKSYTPMVSAVTR